MNSTTYLKSIQKAGRLFQSAPLLLIAFWLGAAGTGMALLARHGNKPGLESIAPAHWPSGSGISPESGQSTLIMFAHPRCPCTRASITELAELAANCGEHFAAQVWFIKPVGTDSDWTNSSMWHQAAAIPGVTVHCDYAGVETSRFHAATSGQSMLYDKNGDLLFEGGITGSRGHVGDNAGLDALEAVLKHTIKTRIQAKVFGCPLFSKDSLQGTTP
jgi:hypothetical protein